MLAMIFVAMPGVVIAGISWECRKRNRAAESAAEDGGTEIDAEASPRK